MKNIFVIFLITLILFWSISIPVMAAEENDIYDSLHESIEKNWNDKMSGLKNSDQIAIKGPLPERILRGIANSLYKQMSSIKGWSLLVGVLSVGIGIFIAVAAKLNKKLRKFAITFFIITIPTLLIIMVFGIAALVSMFIT